MRYDNNTKEKANGVVYTPTEMANYLANQMICYSKIDFSNTNNISILDPAVGEGELLVAMIYALKRKNPNIQIKAVGYETDNATSIRIRKRLEELFKIIEVEIYTSDFLNEVNNISSKFDFIIANPPYIRTQILGAEKAQEISKKLSISGRVDIYYAFLLHIKNLLGPQGIAGYITSNKFLTIKAGTSVREFMVKNYFIHKIVDFGDTKLFSASVLPCIVLFSLGETTCASSVKFTSIYESNNQTKESKTCNSIFDCIDEKGLFTIKNNRKFNVQQGSLENISKGALWLITSEEKKEWLKRVESNTWMHFSDMGKIRVGIKTTADNVFIGNSWIGEKSEIELLRPLITHRDAGQIISKQNTGWKVLYTHTTNKGKKEAVNLQNYPKSQAYLRQHYSQLAGRNYIQKANRNWFEIWVPQNPASWSNKKIVFRDISEKPEFWLDESGAIVNGDCYWIEINSSILDDTVYLALAIANSKFIEHYYDAKFNTKLYSGKRRYMSQYVEQFPIPYMYTPEAQKAIEIVKRIIADGYNNKTISYMQELNSIVDSIFEN